MTPKEKANELIEKYLNMDYGLIKEFIPIPKEGAKQCAFIAVDEIIKAIDWHEFETPNLQLYYWEKVKTEIQKL